MYTEMRDRIKMNKEDYIDFNNASNSNYHSN